MIVLLVTCDVAGVTKVFLAGQPDEAPLLDDLKHLALGQNVAQALFGFAQYKFGLPHMTKFVTVPDASQDDLVYTCQVKSPEVIGPRYPGRWVDLNQAAVSTELDSEFHPLLIALLAHLTK